MLTVAFRLSILFVVVTLLGTGVPHLTASIAAANAGTDHLVVSEIVTGGTSASDELIELYNPTAGPLPLEGLELVYASASGLTVSRRAAWELGAPDVPSGGHVLIAHELGVYAPIADLTYASGMAATGGSVALRIVGASSAIDAVGWGSATSTWLEGSVAPAPPAASSLERLPGGALGSTQDTDDNAADFVVRAVPGPENSASPPVPDPSASGSPQPSVAPTVAPSVPVTPPPPSSTPAVSPSGQPTPSPTPGLDVVPIASARTLLDGTEVTIEGVALTASDFADGGGYVADTSGGVAVLLADGAYARGDRLRITGAIDDRYAQRTLRAAGADAVPLGVGDQPQPLLVTTGAVGEDVEGRLVRIAGTILAAPTALSAGLAFEVDDGSGPVRLLVGSATGIDTGGWGAGFTVDTIGVVGQRDSSGTGTSGYRVQPRDAADVHRIGPAPSPSSSAAPSATPAGTPEPTPAAGVITVAAARQLAKGEPALVRGVVTLAPGLVDPTTAALQDATGAIVLRVGDEAGPLLRGTLVEVRGVRSTLSGMETLRVSTPPRWLGAATEPVAQPVRTGSAGEAHEASLVTVRGGLVANPRRSPAGTISFEVDDGSGPLRISIGSSAGIDATGLGSGTWIEVRGILGQETTGSLPLRGYRVWPRDAADLRLIAPATGGVTTGSGSTGSDGGAPGPTPAPLGSLGAVGGASAAGLPIGATVVAGAWDELDLGGLLWDGVRLVGVHRDAGPLVAGLLGGAKPPLAVQVSGLRVVATDPSTGIPVVSLSDEPGALVPSGLPPAPPLTAIDLDVRDARWVAVVGRLDPRSDSPTLLVDGASIPLDSRCETVPELRSAIVSVTGIMAGSPTRLFVPCGGIVPAPLLARATTSGRVSEPSIARVGATAGAPETTQTSLPAMLLLLAAAMLAGGAGVIRRARQNDEPEPGPGAGGTGESEEAPSPPALTLVPMPRERAP